PGLLSDPYRQLEELLRLRDGLGVEDLAHPEVEPPEFLDRDPRGGRRLGVGLPGRRPLGLASRVENPWEQSRELLDGRDPAQLAQDGLFEARRARLAEAGPDPGRGG